jgi:tRNA G18 (ribose-2'-O)-methylase SpoU
MNYKDLKKVQAKYIIKNTTKEAKDKSKYSRKYKKAILEVEEATIDKVKRGRKYKSTILEAEVEAEKPELEPNTKIVRTNKVLVLLRALVIEISITEDKIILEL